MKTLLPYVPSECDNLNKFKARMKYYAECVELGIQGKEKPLVTPLVPIVESKRQGKESTHLQCSISPTSVSLQNVGFSNTSINHKPLYVVEEGLDHPSYYDPNEFED